MTRTNIDIDEDLLRRVQAVYGLSTKRQAVDFALRRLLVEPMTESEALGMRGAGWAGDLDAVEVLVPSLLLQAHVAMTRCGRRTDGTGTSRTRSFRQSFLLAYAQRIGERLQSADERVVASSGGTAALVPVLTRHREKVDATCEALFPQTVARGGNVNNPQGWWAGLAAADQAQFGSHHAVLDPAQDRAAS